MSRILKRPMFRIGGSANEEGIMNMAVPKRARYADPTGAANPLDNYQVDTESELYKKAMRNAAILNALSGPGRSQSDRISDLLIRGGLNLMSARPTGGILGTAAGAFKEPTEQYLKSGEAEESFKRQLKLAGATQAMASEEAQAKYDKELAIAKMKLEQDAKEAFIKTSGLGTKAAGVFEAVKNLSKSGQQVQEGAISATKTSKGVYKPDSTDVAQIPEGRVFYDTNGNFYKRVKEGPGWVRVLTSGEVIPAPVQQPKTGFSESPGAAYDPRAWNKQKFYESLTKKNTPSTME